MAYALLPRLAGADMTIYPSFDAGYTMSKETASVAVDCRQPWAHIMPMMSAVGGRMELIGLAS